ncbi:hypothetical protein ACSPJ8_001907 [Klebsiella aerogenes]|nr:hypothetical protein [Klebsiella aerogenes]HDT3080582.1 hypothetical protein [Klebsiella aerogenes]
MANRKALEAGALIDNWVLVEKKGLAVTEKFGMQKMRRVKAAQLKF